MAKRPTRPGTGDADDAGGTQQERRGRPRTQAASDVGTTVPPGAPIVRDTSVGREFESGRLPGNSEAHDEHDDDVPASPVEAVSMASEPSEEDIRLRAYQRYLERGGSHGADFDDWLTAEQDLKRRR